MAKRPLDKSEAFSGSWWVETVKTLGVSTVAAGVMLWFGLKYLPLIASSLQQLQMDAAVSHKAFEQHMIEESRKTDQQTALLQRICLISSKTETDKLSCVAILGGNK